MSRPAETVTAAHETSLEKVVKSIIASGAKPKEILEQLSSYDIEWHLTEKGALMIKHWSIAAEDFAPIEHVASLREGQKVHSDAEALEWCCFPLKIDPLFPGKLTHSVGDLTVSAPSSQAFYFP